MTDAVTRTTVSLTVNGHNVDAAPGEMLIAAAERAGTYIPRFCYHPRMKPVGVCRMCLVEVEGPRGATLQPACYVPVTDGMVVTTDSEKVKKTQDGVLEFLLANHPLDCPVCDKGGECPLQDQTLAHGSGETRFIEEKRHFAKPISIGELVLLDRERCIQCSRCTRFAAEVAGDAGIAFAGRGDQIEVAPFPTEPFDSVFSGNTVQICPVGALTAKPYRFTARPWDLEQVESTCTTCSVGCRVAVQSSGDRLTRVLGVDSDPVNHGWLCDKGRFVIDAVVGHDDGDLYNEGTRLTQPLLRRNGELEPATWAEALREAASLLEVGGDRVGAIGGAQLTNEGAYAWERFLRGVVRTENIDAQFDDGLSPALWNSLPRATINDTAAACTVVVIGTDLRNELPVLFLRLREAVMAGTTNVIQFSSVRNAVSTLAKVNVDVRPGETADLVAQLCGTAAASSELELARTLIGADGDGVVIVAGRNNLAEDARVIERSLQQLAARLPRATFLSALRRANVHGALDMGLSPETLPGRRSNPNPGRDARAQLRAMADGEQDVVISLGGDLLTNGPLAAVASDALQRGSMIRVSGHGGPSLRYANVVLPTTVSYERFGTVTNLEGRVSALAPKVVGPGSVWPDLAIAAELAEEFGQNLGLTNPEDTAATIERETGYPTATALHASDAEGVVVGRSKERAPRRSLDPVAFPGVRSADLVGVGSFGGSVATTAPIAGTKFKAAAGALPDITAPDAVKVGKDDLLLVTSRALYDDGAGVAGASALAGLVRPATVRLNHHDATKLGLTAGSVTVRSEHASVVVPLELSDEVVRGCAEVQIGTRGADGVDVASALLGGANSVTKVSVTA